MGACTSYRKRKEDNHISFASFSDPIDQSYVHIAKKLKPSVSMNQNTPGYNRPVSSNSVASRISRYPDLKSGIPRVVHAPVRNSRFRHSSVFKSTEATSSSGESSADKMGFFSLFHRLFAYERTKKSALETLRYVTGGQKEKEKEVIDVDREDENQDGVSDDCSIEEVEIVDSARKKWKGGQGNLDNLQDFSARKVETEVRSLDSSAVTDMSNAIAKVDDREKFLLPDQVPDDHKVPRYSRLLHDAEKRNSKLARIDFNIEFNEKRLQRLHLSRPKEKEAVTKKDVVKECFVPLTNEEEAEVSRAFSNSNRRKVLVTHENSNIDITGEKLQCLKPGAWLNDEVINLYLELLKERERREPQKFLKCHFFNTFFYKKLIMGRRGYDYSAVRRWTTQKKLGYSLLECDKIFVPIHKEVHWCLAIINKKDKKFQYLDSLGGIDHRVLDVLARYIVEEVKEKCGTDIDVSSWEQEFVEDLPEQENGFDCGMFMIKYADFYSRDIGLCFRQENMPYFRRRTAKEILKLRAD